MDVTSPSKRLCSMIPKNDLQSLSALRSHAGLLAEQVHALESTLATTESQLQEALTKRRLLSDSVIAQEEEIIRLKAELVATKKANDEASASIVTSKAPLISAGTQTRPQVAPRVAHFAMQTDANDSMTVNSNAGGVSTDLQTAQSNQVAFYERFGEDFQQRMDELKKENATMHSRLAHLQNEHKVLQESSTRAQALQEEVESLQRQLEAAASAKVSLQASFRDELQNSVTTAVADALREANAQKSHHRFQPGAIAEGIEAERQAQDTQRVLDAAEAYLTASQGALTASSRLSVEAAEKVRDLTRELTDLAAAQQVQPEGTSTENGELQAARSECETLRKAQTLLTVQNENLTAEVKALAETVGKLEHLVGIGAFNPTTTRVLHLRREAPIAGDKEREREKEKEKDAVNLSGGRGSHSANSSSSQVNVSTSEWELERENLLKKMSRLKDVFREKVKEFRTAVRDLFGYTIEMEAVKEGSSLVMRYRLVSTLSPSTQDLVFLASANGLRLIETPWSQSLGREIDTFLVKCHCIPAFTAYLTGQLCEGQTFHA